MNAYVYILRCADGSYYVGSTRTSLEERLAKHNAGAIPHGAVRSCSFSSRISIASPTRSQLSGS